MHMQQMTLLQTSHLSRKNHYHEGALDTIDQPQVIIYVIIRSQGWGSEIERQNPQTVDSDELSGVCCSKRQRVICCICRRNSWHSWLDKKQVVSWTNKRNKMWQRSCVDWIPFIATSKGRKEGRKEGRSKKRWAKWPASKFKMSMDVSCVWNTRSMEKIEAWASLEVQFVGHTSRLWWDGVCVIYKSWPARTGIKGVISALLLLHLLLHSRIEWTSVLTWQVRERERKRETGPVASS